MAGRARQQSIGGALGAAPAPVVGYCDPRFEALSEALRHNFADRGELGGAVVVCLSGTPVVDIWGGWADAARTRPWQADTLVDVFSVGKAMAAVCVLQLAIAGGSSSPHRCRATGLSSRRQERAT